VDSSHKQITMINKITGAFTIILVLIILCMGVFAYAQSSTGGDLCGGDALSQLFCGKDMDLPGMLNQIFQLAIALGGVLAMLRIGYAGWLYMGREDMWSTKQKAKETFRDAIIGLLILLAIWLILHQINPCILQLSILQDNSSCDPTQTF